jgi:hypothetical protein
MSYKPDHNDWMAYLYDELEGAAKEKMEQYLLDNPGARLELENFRQLRQVLGKAEDKEVIAPPIVLGDSKQRFLWNTPVFRIVSSIAASLLVIILAGKFTGLQMSMSGNEFRLSFGETRHAQPVTDTAQPAVSTQEVQQMINEALNQNNLAMQASWQQTQQKLDASLRSNLASNSGKIDKLVKEAANASQVQIRDYVAGLQSQNTQVVKDYFQLSGAEQKKYIENLLVDFAKYLQQQRSDDLQIVQSRLNSLEQNNDVFRQETEQILTSLITTVNTKGGAVVRETSY